MKTILIVDDHPVVLEGLAAVLRAEGYGIVAARSSAEAVQAVDMTERIDVMVIDMSLSDSHDGLDLIRDLRARTDAPVVIYTMHGETWNVERLFESGAEGVVLKGDSIDELIEAVKVVAGGGVYRSLEFSERIDALNSSSGILSDTDIMIMRLICAGVESKDIADKICVSKKTVEYHRSNIIKKLGSNNMAQAINQAVRLGIISFLAAAAPLGAYSDTPVPEAIDLGLSVRWADCNLGAVAPHEPGGYFAFGEVKEKDQYDWATYTHCDDEDMLSQHDIGEESICGTEYDAAHVILGGDWRMPTAEEMEELIESCEMEYIESEPLDFLRLTAPGGAFIDMPVTGYMSLGRVVRSNQDLAVWTGSFYVEAGEEDGFEYYMNSPFFLAGANNELLPFVDEGSPQLGIQIRPVYTGEAGVTAIKSDDDSGRTEIYTIDGRYLPAGHPLAPGIYIKKQGAGVAKVMVN